ncbi:MAG: hypothetical protein KAU35_01680 [candidate division Zixibacteria bacterium]|nr:hypothetical protein [candidate division Zixibacteria bacterium]
MSKLRLMICMAVLLLAGGQTQAVICGNIDNTDRVDISDLVYLVDYMFNDGSPLPYPPAADCDGDGQIDISDLVCWVDHWFLGAPSPTCPFWSVDNHTDIGGTCVPDSAAKTGVPHAAASDDGYLYLEVVGNDLHVHHFQAFYQCCLFYAVDWNQSGNHLVGFEADTGMPCDCICPFNLKSIVHDLEPGEYVVTLVGIYGNVIGIDTAVIGGDGPVLIGYEDSGCLESEPGDPPIINYHLSGDTLTMEHLDAYLNCVADIVVDFALVGDTLRFYEMNISSEAVYCLCYFEVVAAVEGILQGNYVAELYVQEYPDAAIYLFDRRSVSLGN